MFLMVCAVFFLHLRSVQNENMRYFAENTRISIYFKEIFAIYALLKIHRTRKISGENNILFKIRGYIRF